MTTVYHWAFDELRDSSNGRLDLDRLASTAEGCTYCSGRGAALEDKMTQARGAANSLRRICCSNVIALGRSSAGLAMARLPRLKVRNETAWYHLYARVAGSLNLFPLDHPSAHFKLLEIIQFYTRGYSCEPAAFSIMGNHYHLVLRMEQFRRLSPDELINRARYFYPRSQHVLLWRKNEWDRFNKRLFDVSELMRNIQMAYAKWHNRKFNRRGGFWEDRFKSTLLAHPEAVQECILYVDLNAVRARLVELPEKWKRSSAYLRYIGKDKWLVPLSELFPATRRTGAFEHYREMLLFRGTTASQSGGGVIATRALQEEAARGFCRRGVYLNRLRYFTDGVVLGAERQVEEWFTRLKREGKCLQRRYPIFHREVEMISLRGQRTLAGHCPG